MVSILIVSHGALSTQLVATSRMIVGDHECLHSIQLEPHQGFEDVKKAISEKYEKEKMKDEGLLVLADLQGGTPCNGAFMMLDKLKMSIVSGVNLPMLLEILVCRNGKTLDELTGIAVQSGKEGIRNISEIYHSRKIVENAAEKDDLVI